MILKEFIRENHTEIKYALDTEGIDIFGMSEEEIEDILPHFEEIYNWLLSEGVEDI